MEQLAAITKSLADAGLQAPVPPPVKWVGSVLPAALWALDPSHPRGDSQAGLAYGLEPGSRIIVLMVDGLGFAPLADRLSYARNLRALPSEPVLAQSTVPSTTASALTAFTTGEMPGQTRMIGYSVRHGAAVMNLLNFAPGVSPEDWQPIPTLFETLAGGPLAATMITKPQFLDSGLTRAAFRGSNFVGRETLEQRFGEAIDGAHRGEPLQVVYSSDIDHTGHRYGVRSPQWAEAVEQFDAALGAFLSRLPRDVQVVMTADHGMVDVEQIIDVATVPELSQDVEVIAGEGRAVHIHASPGRADDVLARWQEHLEGVADVIPTADLGALMSPGPGLDQVGAGVAFLRGRTVILDSRTQSPSVFGMKGVHGSLTFDEMAIPVWRLA